MSPDRPNPDIDGSTYHSVRRTEYFKNNFYLGLFIIIFFLIVAEFWFKVFELIIDSTFTGNPLIIYTIVALIFTLIFIHLVRNILHLPITFVT